MMVRFDAYTATTLGAKHDDLAQVLMDKVGLGQLCQAEIRQSKGFHTFGHRMGFSLGGHAFAALLEPSIEVKKARKIMGGKAGDWDDFPEKGRTLYLGSKSSPVRMRLYEKGLQPEYQHLNRPNWARIEVQVRPAKEAKTAFSDLSAMDVWGASRWTRDIAGRVLEQHVDPHPAGSTYRLTAQETALRWMCKQYGAHLASLAQDLGGWDCVGLTLKEILEEQSKGR